MFVAGINPTEVWTSSETPDFAVGTVGMGHNGRVYRLVQADATGVTGAGYVVSIADGSIVDMITTTVSAPGTGAGLSVGVAMAAIAASGYGWVCVYGFNVPVRVAASAAKGTLLNTTATEGQLDDDATAGAEVIAGIALDTANGGSAGNADATVVWPTVSRTL